MKKTVLVGSLSLLVILLGLGIVYAQQKDSSTKDEGVASQQQQGWYCPWCGRWEGPGTTQPGGMWMHRGWKMGPGSPPAPEARKPVPAPATKNLVQPPAAKKLDQPVSLDQAKSFLERYLASVNNPNLKLGKITEEKDHYLAEVTTKDGSLVDKVKVDKKTGGMRSAY